MVNEIRQWTLIIVQVSTRILIISTSGQSNIHRVKTSGWGDIYKVACGQGDIHRVRTIGCGLIIEEFPVPTLTGLLASLTGDWELGFGVLGISIAFLFKGHTPHY